MADTPQPLTAALQWKGDLTFTATSGSTSITLDSNSSAGPSPMQVLAEGLAGCMAIDIVIILQKGRHDLKALRVDFSGDRAAEPPRRFETIHLAFHITGNVPAVAVERAIELSHDKYCSVWHSLRQDIRFTTSFDIQP
jgi:putative redox protein